MVQVIYEKKKQHFELQKAFTMDERIAWCHVQIPQDVFNGETNDDWYTLSGKQGDGKEGMLNIVLSYAVIDSFFCNRMLTNGPWIY